MAYPGIPSIGSGLLTQAGSSNGRSLNPVFEKTKSVTYHETLSDQIYAISAAPLGNATESIPRSIEVQNNGPVPIFIMIGYSSYSTDTAIVETDYLHILLTPGESFNPPVRAVISDDNDDTIMFGTKIDNAVPASVMYTAIADCYIDGAGLASGTTATTFNVDDNAGSPAAAVGFFRVGDLIRIENEILEITAIAANTGTEAQLTVKRGVHGSTAATHADDTQLRHAFFNAYHDFDKYSVAQTDFNGKFLCYNLMGQARANSGVQGIIPGSFAIKFYDSGYQSFGLSGISSVTHSGLTASRLYGINLAVDGGSVFTDLSFTTDTTDLTFGKVIELIQSALNVQFYTAGNLFEKQVYVGIENGDVVFRSASNLEGSAISLAVPTGAASEYNPFGVGRIPAIGNINTAVAAKLPDDVTYDRVTYAQIPNSGAFGYDDGNGNLVGKCRGTINYETGALDIISAPKNAQFVVTALTKSAFSGKLNESETGRINSLVEILANTPSQKWNGSVKIETW